MLQKVKGKLDFWKRTIVLYGREAGNRAQNVENIEFLVLKSWDEWTPWNWDGDEQEYKKRFEAQHLCFVLVKDKKVVAYGWGNSGNTHYLGELALKMEIKKPLWILYDYYTFPEHRGQGLYPLLLQQIVAANDKPKLIYVLKDNTGSIRGIEKAGFNRLGQITGWSRNSYQRYLDKLWQK